MSNSSILSLIFERYTKDALRLRELYNLCLTSVSENANIIRTDALSIQLRWEPFSLVARLKPARALGVETIAEDINNYISRQFFAVGTYLHGVLRALLMARSIFPGIDDDYELGQLASVSLDANIKNSGDRILQALAVVDENFNVASVREDDRDPLMTLAQLDAGFARVALWLHPDARTGSNRHYSPIDGDVGVTAALTLDSTVSARLSPINTNDVVTILAAPAGGAADTCRIGRVSRPCYAVLRVRFPDTIRTAGGAIPGTSFTGAAAAVISGGVNAEANLEATGYYMKYFGLRLPANSELWYSINNAWVAFAGGERIVITVVSITEDEAPTVAFGGATEETVAQAVNAGRLSYFSAAFQDSAVAEVLQLALRHDIIIRRNGGLALNDIVRSVWRTAATAALPGNNVVINALQGLTPSMVYSPVFWAMDPLGVGTVVTITDPWVLNAYESMYRAFYQYISLLVNSGAVNQTSLAVLTV